MPRFQRRDLMQRFQDMVRRGEPIIGGGAGIGLSAKCEEAGGIDLIVLYNSGRYRMAGRGSLAGLLAYGNANDIVLEMAHEVLPVIRHTPVIAGVNGTDPFLLTEAFFGKLKDIGIAGVQNFPTVGLIDGIFRQNLEETGMGFAHEVDMIRIAGAMDLLTTPYVFCEADATAMAEAGADIIIAHMGLTTGGAIGAQTAPKLTDCPALIDAWAVAAKKVRADIIVLCHGGPIATPDDAQYILNTSRHCNGFYGASSMERLPVEVAINRTHAAVPGLDPAIHRIEVIFHADEGHRRMTVFRSDTAPPAWCELEHFEIITLQRDQGITRRPSARTERLIGTSGTCQLRRGGTSLLLKEAQFIDIDPDDGAWTMLGASDPSQFVLLSGHWGQEMAGCGLFRVQRSDAGDKGDPVPYPKHTAIDRHYHDCDEYWIVLEGAGEVVVDDRHAKVGPGDCLCIGTGHPHDFPLIERPVKAVFFETTLYGRKRIGHLWNHTHGPAEPMPGRV